MRGALTARVGKGPGSGLPPDLIVSSEEPSAPHPFTALIYGGRLSESTRRTSNLYGNQTRQKNHTIGRSCVGRHTQDQDRRVDSAFNKSKGHIQCG